MSFVTSRCAGATMSREHGVSDTAPAHHGVEGCQPYPPCRAGVPGVTANARTSRPPRPCGRPRPRRKRGQQTNITRDCLTCADARIPLCRNGSPPAYNKGSVKLTPTRHGLAGASPTGRRPGRYDSRTKTTGWLAGGDAHPDCTRRHAMRGTHVTHPLQEGRGQ